MCSFQTLYYNNDCGYVVRCADCDNIQIGYGNVLITFHESEFKSFRYWLGQIEENQIIILDSAEYKIKSVIVPTPCEGLKLLLTQKELVEFNKMLDAADTEIQSQQMLKLFIPQEND
ncbi:MAG: DUF6686 family protein [Panacibacter sp.]